MNVGYARAVRADKSYPIQDAWRLNTARRFAWAQRFLFWLAQKLGASPHFDIRSEVVRFEPREIVGKIMERIETYKDDLERDGRVAKWVFLGADQYGELLQTRQDPYFGFETGIVFNERERRSGLVAPVHHVMGLTVVFVPWMTGILIVPESMIYSDAREARRYMHVSS